MEVQPLDDEGLEPLDLDPQRVVSRPRRRGRVVGQISEPGPTEAEVDESGSAQEDREESHPHVSARQLAANRENAKRSTGPRTDAGKQTSAQNAIKHGYYANRAEPVRRGALAEDEQEFRDRRQTLIESMHPSNMIQEALADVAAANFTTIDRLSRYEALMLSNDGKAMPSLAANERKGLAAALALPMIHTLRRLICQDMSWDEVDPEAIALLVLDMKNGGEPIPIEGLWDAKHKPRTEKEWETVAKLLIKQLLPKGSRNRLRWIDDEIFRLRLDRERFEAVQEEAAARHAVERTYAQTIPKMTSLLREQRHLLDALRLMQKES